MKAITSRFRSSGCSLTLVALLCGAALNAHSQTLEEKWAALTAINQRFDSLPGIDPDRENEELLAFILARPEFSTGGIRQQSVWAKFTDGEEIVVVNNLLAPDSPGAPPNPEDLFRLTPSEQTSGKEKGVRSEEAFEVAGPVGDGAPELPTSLKARLIGSGFVGSPWDPLPNLRSWLMTEQNYTEPLAPADASVSGLKNVGGDGVLVLNTHGGPSSNTYILWTATLATPELDVVLAEDRNPPDGSPPRLLRVEGKTWNVDRRAWVTETRYAITPAFVDHYWHDFSTNGFVVLLACHSGSDAAEPMRQAIFDKHASVIAAWTGSTYSDVISNTAKLLFDRLLGANHVYSEADGYKQRPFPWHQVATDLGLHGLGTDPRTGSQLRFFAASPDPMGGFGLLAPSIWYVFAIEELDELHIIGRFGSDPRPNGTVTVGDAERRIVRWDPYHLAVELPRSGVGSAGDVVVTVRQHKSNAARLTEWPAQFRVTLEGPESIRQPATYQIRIRADLRTARVRIHEPPGEWVAGRYALLEGVGDSRATYSCSGSTSWRDVAGITWTVSWTGSGDLVLTRGTPTAPNWFDFAALIRGSHRIDISSHINPTFLGCTTNTHYHLDPDIDFDFPGQSALPSSIGGLLEVNPVIVTILDDGRILGDSRTTPVAFFASGPSVLRLEWDDILPRFPPDPDSAR